MAQHNNSGLFVYLLVQSMPTVWRLGAMLWNGSRSRDIDASETGPTSGIREALVGFNRCLAMMMRLPGEWWFRSSRRVTSLLYVAI